MMPRSACSPTLGFARSRLASLAAAGEPKRSPACASMERDNPGQPPGFLQGAYSHLGRPVTFGGAPGSCLNENGRTEWYLTPAMRSRPT